VVRAVGTNSKCGCTLTSMWTWSSMRPGEVQDAKQSGSVCAADRARAQRRAGAVNRQRDYAVTPVTPAQLSSELAWREGAIVFDGSRCRRPSPKSNATRMHASSLPMRVRGAAVGAVSAPMTAGLHRWPAAALPVTIRRTPDGLVYVDPRP